MIFKKDDNSHTITYRKIERNIDDARIIEAQKLGFSGAIIPPIFGKDKKEKGLKNYDLSCYEIGHVQRLINWFN